jgi:iron complex outermembrane receptor protein
LRTVLGCTLVLGSALPLAAALPPRLKDLTLEELANVEVTTPGKMPESAFRTPAAVYVLTQDEIRRSGATNIPEALRLVPGVEVSRIDSYKWAIGIRGFATRLSKGVLVLIDGRSVYTPLFAGVYWEAQDVPLQDVERVEVIRGPGATIWGPERPERRDQHRHPRRQRDPGASAPPSWAETWTRHCSPRATAAPARAATSTTART